MFKCCFCVIWICLPRLSRAKKAAPLANKVDRQEARRGKGLATKFPFRETEGEKGRREREEIWREKEEELAGPPFFLSSLLPFSPPYVWLFFPSLSFFLLWLLGRKWKVKGEQEVRTHSFAVCVVKFGEGVKDWLRREGTF